MKNVALLVAAIIVGAVLILSLVVVVLGIIEYQRELRDQKKLEVIRNRVKRAPYRMSTPISNGRPMFITLRPLDSDQLPAKVREDLVQLVRQLPEQQVRTGVRFEYDGESWKVLSKGKGPYTPPATPLQA